MSLKVTLIVWTEEKQLPGWNWPWGAIYFAQPSVAAAQALIGNVLQTHHPDAILFWDARLGQPDAALVEHLLAEPVDIWHAGLRLGTAGQPADLDYLISTWMLHLDPSPTVRAVSWRVSLRAALIRTPVLQALGQIDSVFTTLDAAGLEMGYRYAWRGAVMVNEPRLIGMMLPNRQLDIPPQDFYAFVFRHFRPFWQKYALGRRILAAGHPRREWLAYRLAQARIRQQPPAFSLDAAYEHPADEYPQPVSEFRISVLIPTLVRYPYLKDTLDQLCAQTIHPLEVICVDQTPLAQRQPELYDAYPDLNLKVIWRDQPGQCSARNAGLQQVQGDWVLFLDDDIRIPPNYIERLVAGMWRYQVDIGQGVWAQDTDRAVAEIDRRFRLADRFASGNCLARLTTIQRVGGFDLQYDRNYRADADLGMRLYLAGAISIIIPDVHEHSFSAPVGGLKFHGAFDGLRKMKWLAPWPVVTQMYLWLRYLPARQVREALLLTYIASAVPREARYTASMVKKVLYFLGQFCILPFRLVGIYRSWRQAQDMLTIGPRLVEEWLLPIQDAA